MTDTKYGLTTKTDYKLFLVVAVVIIGVYLRHNIDESVS
jgi:hypothetical protein